MSVQGRVGSKKKLDESTKLIALLIGRNLSLILMDNKDFSP